MWEIVDLGSQWHQPCPEPAKIPPLVIKECLFPIARKREPVHEPPIGVTWAGPVPVLLKMVAAAEMIVVVGALSQRVLPALHSASVLVEQESRSVGLVFQWLPPY